MKRVPIEAMRPKELTGLVAFVVSSLRETDYREAGPLNVACDNDGITICFVGESDPARTWRASWAELRVAIENMAMLDREAREYLREREAEKLARKAASTDEAIAEAERAGRLVRLPEKRGAHR